MNRVNPKLSSPHLLIALNKRGSIIRNANKEDIQSVLDIENESQATPWTSLMFLDCLKNYNEFFVIEDTLQNIVLGFIVFFVHGFECQILNFAIKPSHRKKGYGRILLTHALQCAKGSKATVTILEVRESNNKAIMLYKSLGFYEIGRRKGYYPKTKTSEEENAEVLQLDMHRFLI